MLHKKRSTNKVTAINAELSRRRRILEKHLMLIGKKSAARVAGMTDTKEIQSVLREEIDSAFKAAEAEINTTR